MTPANHPRLALGKLSSLLACTALSMGCPAGDDSESNGDDASDSSAGPTATDPTGSSTDPSTSGATDSADTSAGPTSSSSESGESGSGESGDSSTGEIVCGDPIELGVYTPSSGNARGFEVVGDMVYLAIESGGIAVVDITDPGTPVEVSVLDLDPGQLVQRMAFGGDTIYAGLRGAGWTAIDITDPSMPAEIFHEPNVSGQDVAFADDVLYVADVNGVQIFDVTDPANPVPLVEDLVLPGSTQSVVLSGTFAYATGLAAGLSVIDISDPAAAFEVTTLDFDGRGFVAVNGDHAFLSASDGVHIVDIADPTGPVELGLFAAERAQGVAAGDRLWMISDDTTGSDVAFLIGIDYVDPASPLEVFAGFETFDDPSWIEVSDGRVLFSEQNDDALHILDACPTR